MNQVWQFVKWTVRDFLSCFKMSPFTLFIILFFGQIGLSLASIQTHNKELEDILMVTLPLTLLIFFIVLGISIQWDRFKRHQDQIMRNLKD